MLTPLLWSKFVPADKRNVEVTDMNWEVYPESIYEMLKKFSKYKCFKEIIVTESGASFPDVVINGKVNDVRRINYLDQHIKQVFRARQEGVNVNGFFAWCLTDNFEWKEGYRPKFGLVHIDFETQQRIIKDSGFWFSRLIQSKIF